MQFYNEEIKKYEEKYKEHDDKIKYHDRNILTMMGIFLAIFSFIGANASIIPKLSSSLLQSRFCEYGIFNKWYNTVDCYDIILFNQRGKR